MSMKSDIEDRFIPKKSDMCNGQFCTCGKCVRCGHCNMKREAFATWAEYSSHIQHCPKRPGKEKVNAR